MVDRPNPAPAELWQRAADRYPHNVAERRRYYRDLMVRYGYIESGPSKPMPCGWKPRTADPEDT